MRIVTTGASTALSRIMKFGGRRQRNLPRVFIGLILVTLSLSAAAWAEGEPDAGQISYFIIQPEETNHQLKDGDELKFYAFWDSAHYEVKANLYQIDSNIGSLEADWPVGEYAGEQPIMAGSDVLKHAYLFTHTISSNSSSADGSKTIKIQATNPNSETSDSHYDLHLCLANNPPVNTHAKAIGDSIRFIAGYPDSIYIVRNGDPLHIETEWEFSNPDFTITADFSELDDNFETNRVHYSGPSTETTANYTIFYSLSDEAKAATVSGENYPVTITGLDGKCGIVTRDLIFRIDNVGPKCTTTDPLTASSLPDTTSETHEHLFGLAPAESHDVLVRIDNRVDTVFETVRSGGSLGWAGDVEITAGFHFVEIFSRDVVGNLSVYSDGEGNLSPFSIEYEIVGRVGGQPQFRNCMIQEPEVLWINPLDGTTPETSQLKISDGTHIRFLSYWDNIDAYEVWADFSNIDTFGPTHHPGTLVGSIEQEVAGQMETWNIYAFDYFVTASTENDIDDGRNLVVPVTAYSPYYGTETTSSALSCCMSNDPIEHLWTRIINEPLHGNFHEEIADTTWLVSPGYQIKIMTSWLTPHESLNPWVYFTEADDNFDPALVDNMVNRSPVDSLSEGSVHTYLLSYTFSNRPLSTDAQTWPLMVPVVLTDQGCGRDTTYLLLEMDQIGPASNPVLDLPPSPKTVDSTVVISGVVSAETAEVEIEVSYSVDERASTIIPVDENMRFSGESPALQPGDNTLAIYSRDLMRNRSEQTAEEYIVSRISNSTITIPKPFHPGDSFDLDNVGEWGELDLTIYNLEGDQICAFSRSGMEILHGTTIAWDGLNSYSESVRQGPYLLRIIARDTDGNTVKEEVKAFVFTK